MKKRGVSDETPDVTSIERKGLGCMWGGKKYFLLEEKGKHSRGLAMPSPEKK